MIDKKKKNVNRKHDNQTEHIRPHHTMLLQVNSSVKAFKYNNSNPI